MEPPPVSHLLHQQQLQSQQLANDPASAPVTGDSVPSAAGPVPVTAPGLGSVRMPSATPFAEPAQLLRLTTEHFLAAVTAGAGSAGAASSGAVTSSAATSAGLRAGTATAGAGGSMSGTPLSLVSPATDSTSPVIGSSPASTTAALAHLQLQRIGAAATAAAAIANSSTAAAAASSSTVASRPEPTAAVATSTTSSLAPASTSSSITSTSTPATSTTTTSTSPASAPASSHHSAFSSVAGGGNTTSVGSTTSNNVTVAPRGSGVVTPVSVSPASGATGAEPPAVAASWPALLAALKSGDIPINSIPPEVASALMATLQQQQQQQQQQHQPHHPIPQLVPAVRPSFVHAGPAGPLAELMPPLYTQPPVAAMWQQLAAMGSSASSHMLPFLSGHHNPYHQSAASSNPYANPYPLMQHILAATPAAHVAPPPPPPAPAASATDFLAYLLQRQSEVMHQSQHMLRPPQLPPQLQEAAAMMMSGQNMMAIAQALGISLPFPTSPFVGGPPAPPPPPALSYPLQSQSSMFGAPSGGGVKTEQQSANFASSSTPAPNAASTVNPTMGTPIIAALRAGPPAPPPLSALPGLSVTPSMLAAPPQFNTIGSTISVATNKPDDTFVGSSALALSKAIVDAGPIGPGRRSKKRHNAAAFHSAAAAAAEAVKRERAASPQLPVSTQPNAAAAAAAAAVNGIAGPPATSNSPPTASDNSGGNDSVAMHDDVSSGTAYVTASSIASASSSAAASDSASGSGAPKSTACTICSKNFKTNWELTRHLRTHSGERPFQCDVCGRSFSQRGDVYRHARIHTGERPFVCPHGACKQAFSRKCSLTAHLASNPSHRPESQPVPGASVIAAANAAARAARASSIAAAAAAATAATASTATHRVAAAATSAIGAVTAAAANDGDGGGDEHDNGGTGGDGSSGGESDTDSSSHHTSQSAYSAAAGGRHA